MEHMILTKTLHKHLKDFRLARSAGKSFHDLPGEETRVESITLDNGTYPLYTNEFWTARQRQSSSLHEVSYRACFKAQLPAFFINLLTGPRDLVYDPFSGRGTTVLEAALLGRRIVANDMNPISRIVAEPRLELPDIKALSAYLAELPLQHGKRADIDLSMFYHPDTESELISLRDYLTLVRQENRERPLDRWIRMIATNRLTGHSAGFFSVYTLPPNQAVSGERQRKINDKREQVPGYRDVRKLILKKSKSLLRNLTDEQRSNLKRRSRGARFITGDARSTPSIADNSVRLTVTSPPFLDVVQYADDNWLRCWFNGIDSREIAEKLSVTCSLDDWCEIMGDVFRELFRITRPGGWVAFEVGEVRSGKVRLEEQVVPLGVNAGFRCEAILINEQSFTKTSNIWGIKNNHKGTNSNRIVIFRKNPPATARKP